MQSQYLIRDTDARFAENKFCGNKAATLARISPLVRTPKSVVLSTDAFKDSLVSIDKNAAPAYIRSELFKVELSSSIKSAIEEICHLFSGEILVVRSSSSIEDGKSNSAAGLFETQVGIPASYSLLERAIKRVWVSYFSDRAITYRRAFGVQTEPLMAVLIQPIVKATASGVAFSKHPIHGNGMLIEAIPGLGFPLVSNQVIPDRYSVIDGDVTQTLAIKHLAYVVHTGWRRKIAGDPIVWRNGNRNIQSAFLKYVAGGIAAIRIVDKEFRSRSVLTVAQINAIAKISKQLESFFATAVDIEWAFEANELTILQARPVTRVASARTMSLGMRHEDGQIIDGVGLAPGIAKGIVSSPNRASQHLKNVLVTRELAPEDILDIMNHKALVVGVGGILSHVAILCRELGIPCVQTRDYWMLEDGVEVIVDGNAGKLYLLNRGDH
ncbi:MAG: hypothetical protein GXO35_05820 [Gammaproteobacteria bacterium]|nr:hypothetical protein [Gammaproteobacteria bacterium]